jgi:hypothetical protein
VGNHEIWKGVTCDDGASFQWTPMTMNSQNENLRPVVPKWNAQNSALLWFRGNYTRPRSGTTRKWSVSSASGSPENRGRERPSLPRDGGGAAGARRVREAALVADAGSGAQNSGRMLTSTATMAPTRKT